MDRTTILAAIGAVSLIWGVYDLRKKGGGDNPYARWQSWAQVIAGVLALGFAVLNALR